MSKIHLRSASTRRRFGVGRHPIGTISVTARLFLSLLLLNLLVLSWVAWALYESRLKYIENATVEVENLAQLLSHDIAASMREFDLALQATVTEVERQNAASSLNAQALDYFIEQQLLQHPDLDGLRVADAQGRLTQGTGVLPSTAMMLADRDYFVWLRRDPGAGLVVGQLVLGRISDTWVIPLARAIRTPEGGFAGIVVGAVQATRFTRAFAALTLGSGGAFTLLDSEMRVVARYPDPVGREPVAGMTLVSEVLQALVRSDAIEGRYQAVSPIDGVYRISGYRKVPGVSSLHVVAGQSTEKVLSGWRQEAVQASVLVLVFMLATLVLSWFIHRGWRQQAQVVAALQEVNRTLAIEKHLSQTIIQSSPVAIYTRNQQGAVTAWNPAAEKLFGWSAEEILGQPLLSVPVGKEEETRELRDRVLRGETIQRLEVQRKKRDGTVFDLSATLAPLRGVSGQVEGYVTLATDITERKQAERQIEFLAYRDVLTGLPNRLLLQDRFAQAVAYAERSGMRMALLFIDLDNFKAINDSLGHAVGDALLKEIALRLGACVRDTDTISRQGGDEFLVVLSDLASADAITPVLTKLRERLQEVFVLDGHELTTSASIGIAMYPDDGRDFETLLKKADTAMYQAKDAGRNGYRFFDEQMNSQAVEHLRLKNGLRYALARQEFELHYQPQMDLQTAQILGVEALLRWRHPQHGLLMPTRFVPVAEDSGMIVPMGEWVLHEACRQAVAWQQAGLPPLTMAVNLSAVEFKRGDVEHKVMQALARSGLDPHHLALELTESVLIHNTEQVLSTVRRLKQLGVRLSIDDFGTGYSSLSYLKRFDVDKLKIDQSFVRDLATDPDDAAIIRAIIQMAHSLNLRTLAEGVETAEILAQLRAFGCDEAQGYCCAPPMTALACMDFLAQWPQRQRLSSGLP